MSDTPRTDEVEDKVFFLVDADFARHLERENNELRASNDRMFKINEGLLAENAKMAEALLELETVTNRFPVIEGSRLAAALDAADAALASHAAQIIP